MKRLLTSTDTLYQVLNAVANGITVQDPKGRLIFVNNAGAKMMNCASPEEAIAKGVAAIMAGFKYYDERGQEIALDSIPGSLAIKGVDEPPILLGYTSKKQPVLRWTSVKTTPVFDEDGKVTMAVSVLQDVTEIKDAERRLKEANDRITKLLEQTLGAP